MSLTRLLLLIPLAYVIGSIPVGLMVALSRGVDPRQAGSGNIGATNVGRLLGGKIFVLVFSLDVLKGMTPVLIAGFLLHFQTTTMMQSLLWMAVGFAAIAGNLFSLFLRFKGGKGVATSAGVLLGMFPCCTLPAIAAVVVWLVIFAIWRYVSLASITAAACFPVAYAAIGAARHWHVLTAQLPILIFALLVPVLIIYKHRTNIVRLRAGTESRFGTRKTPAPGKNDAPITGASDAKTRPGPATHPTDD